MRGPLAKSYRRGPQIPRVFALVELLRGVAAFLAAPILLDVAMTAGSSATDVRTSA